VASGWLSLARIVRWPVLLLVGALCVHHGRYLLAFGSDAGEQSLAHGHAYLSGVVPWVVLAALLLSIAFLAALVRAWRTGELEAAPRSFRVLWLAGSAALVAIYTGQELAEGLLAPGHEAGLSGVLGAGGWTALPLALLAAAAIAWLSREAPALIARAAALGARQPAAPRAHRGTRLPLPRDARPPRDVLAAFLAGRGPPLQAA
jgi:hypothetical protein